MSARMLVKCGALLDVRTGELRPRQAVLIEERSIAWVGSQDAVPGATPDKTLDLGGATLLPGLIDCHTHLTDDAEQYSVAGPLMRSGARVAFESIPNAAATLAAGFTTVRDVGTYRAFVDVALRDAIDAGVVPGPRMVPAGAYVTISGGAGAITGLAPDVSLPLELRFGEANGADQVRARVRAIIRHGVGVIKVLATGAVLTPGSQPGAQEMTEDELRAAVEEATHAGLKVACHCHGAAGAKAAIRAGVASIEHGSLLDEEALQMMLERGTYLVADLYNIEVIRRRPGGYLQEFLCKAEDTGGAQTRTFQRAMELGVRLAYGTDAAVIPHGDNGRQFHTYVQCGMSPLQAIQTATVNAADLLGWQDRVGCIEPGLRADMIAVADNPLQDVRTLERPVCVIKDGHCYAQGSSQ